MKAIEMAYKISSRAYLSRARSRLAEGTTESLFYAALELRCGIEARMTEYLEMWDHITDKRKKGWRIADLGVSLEKAFRSGDKTIEFAVYHKETDELISCFYYTPVTSHLRKAGKKLGTYLHSMKIVRKANDVWWNKLRTDLMHIAKDLEIANTGTLL